jgi:hypothetical protein
MTDQEKLNRRHWMGATAGALSLAAGVAPRLAGGGDAPRRPRIAAVVTEFTHRSHAHVILENFLEPYYFNGRLTDPGVDVAGLYVDQFPAGDMARDVAREYGIGIFPSIAETLRLGGAELAVDGVLLIGEHGDYPLNERGQKMYPRKQFFDEIVAVFRRDGGSCRCTTTSTSRIAGTGRSR